MENFKIEVQIFLFFYRVYANLNLIPLNLSQNVSVPTQIKT